MMKNHVMLFLIPVFGVAMFSGCFGPPKPDGLPPTHPCVITITQSGEPLASASVRMKSEDESLQGWLVAGFTGEDGKARMWTHGKWEGAPLGKFKVTVEKFQNEGPEENPTGVYLIVAKKYTEVDTTDLEMEVVKKGKNEMTFDVGAPVKDRVRN